MEFKDFTAMPVWRLSLDLLKKVYQISSDFPEGEKFGLVSDMRRAANSITHSIAEGYGRQDILDKSTFYESARSSAFALISHLLVSFELRYLVNRKELDDLIERCKTLIDELDALIKIPETNKRT